MKNLCEKHKVINCPIICPVCIIEQRRNLTKALQKAIKVLSTEGYHSGGELINSLRKAFE